MQQVVDGEHERAARHLEVPHAVAEEAQDYHEGALARGALILRAGTAALK